MIAGSCLQNSMSTDKENPNGYQKIHLKILFLIIELSGFMNSTKNSDQISFGAQKIWSLGSAL